MIPTVIDIPKPESRLTIKYKEFFDLAMVVVATAGYPGVGSEIRELA